MVGGPAMVGRPGGHQKVAPGTTAGPPTILLLGILLAILLDLLLDLLFEPRVSEPRLPVL